MIQVIFGMDNMYDNLIHQDFYIFLNLVNHKTQQFDQQMMVKKITI